MLDVSEESLHVALIKRRPTDALELSVSKMASLWDTCFCSILKRFGLSPMTMDTGCCEHGLPKKMRLEASE